MFSLARRVLPRPVLRYQHLGSMMSLGAFNAAVDLPVAVPGALTQLLQASPLRPIYNTLGVKFGAPGAGARCIANARQLSRWWRGL